MDGPGIGSRRKQGGGVRVYFCCCPFTLLLAPPLLLGHLARYGLLRLIGRPVATPWSGLAAERAPGNAEEGR
jgi:hypothetical protein